MSRQYLECKRKTKLLEEALLVEEISRGNGRCKLNVFIAVCDTVCERADTNTFICGII